MEEAYYARTKVWPIMHIIAIQKRVLDENPWVARNLYNAFVEAKRRSIERLLDPAVSRYPLSKASRSGFRPISGIATLCVTSRRIDRGLP
jgi:hypothetical protein